MKRPDENWHEVRQGEWLNSIARQYNIRDPKRIWEHGNNARLKSQRDPNVLFPGDLLYIPPVKEKEETRATDAHHKFQAKSFLERFEVTLKDPNGKPYVNLKYHLIIRGREYNGVTDGSGSIRVEKLEVQSGDVARLELPEVFRVYNIKLGGMNPIKSQAGDVNSSYDNGLSGALMRLKNTGYYRGHIPNRDSVALIDPSHFQHSVKNFQIAQMKMDAKAAHGELDEATRSAILKESII